MEQVDTRDEMAALEALNFLALLDTTESDEADYFGKGIHKIKRAEDDDSGAFWEEL